MLVVQEYQECDFAGLCELMNHWKYDYSVSEYEMRKSIEHILVNPSQKLLVVKRDAELVAYTHVARSNYVGGKPLLEVVHLLVAEHCRSMGIGSLLLDAVRAEAESQHLSVIRLSSQLHRSRAHVFYEKQGFSQIKISKFYEKSLI